jgi:hypothetical protein
MRKLIQASKLMFVAAVLGAAIFGVSTAQARFPCLCPDIYLPVLCDGGKIFPNGCVAACAGATGCVPIDVPIE